MSKIRTSIPVFVALTLFALVPLTAAQSDPSLPPLVAATSPDMLYLYGDTGASQVITESLFSLPRVKWSPDGLHLTYARQDDAGISLVLTDFDTTTTLANLSSGVLLPVAYAPDSTRVYYAEALDARPQDGDNGPEVAVDVYSRTLLPLGEPERIGALTWYGLGCGGGSPFPMDHVRGMESGFMGNDLVFRWTRYGIVYSLNCTADGLGLFDLATGTSEILVEDFARPAFSPDGSQIAGVRFERNAPNPASLAVFDLDSSSVYPMQTRQPPDQVAWAGDGAIYYSTRIQSDEPLTLEGDTTLAYGVEIPTYTVTLNRLNRISGEETEVFSTQAWGVGRLESTAFDLYFSIIPSGREWLAALASGELPLEAAADVWLSWQYVAPELHRVSLASGETTLLGKQIAQFVLRPTG